MKYGTSGHIADLVLWVEAGTRADLFRDAPLALARLMVEGHGNGGLQWQEIRLEALDEIGLMVQLLNEVIYRLEASNLVAVEHVVERLTDTGLESRLGLMELDPKLHRPGEPVKAATYHQASLEKNGVVWRMRVTLDV